MTRIKKYQKLSALVIVLSMLLVIWHKASARPDESGLTWQTLSASSIHLGIRDKYGALGNYKALFIIKDSKGNKIQKLISVNGDDEGTVCYSMNTDGDFTFPANWAFTGNYSWVCVVNNKVVSGGKFSKTHVGNMDQVRTYEPY